MAFPSRKSHLSRCWRDQTNRKTAPSRTDCALQPEYSLKGVLRHARFIIGPMLKRVFIAQASVLSIGIVLIAADARAQLDAFHTRFDATLNQHGVVGGGFAFVHGPDPATQFFFGEANREAHQRV